MTRSHLTSSTILLLVLVLMIGTSLTAQTASLTGRIVDPQGGAVANALVTLTGAGQGPRSTRSSNDGSFVLDGVGRGDYVLQVEASGFAPWSEKITLGTDRRTLNVALQIAGISEDVTVRGTAAGIAATGKTTLPLRELPLTVHGVSGQLIREQGTNDLVTALQNVAGVNPFTTYGVYEYYAFRGFLDSVQLVDGVRNEGNRVNTQLTNIERVDVLKGPSSALYGGGALGATVNLIRKKPSSMPGYDLVASAGSWKTGRGAFGAGGRLGSDAALYRLDIGAESKEGYRHNDATRFTVTPSLAWRVARNDQVNAYYTLNRDKFAGDAGIPLLNTDFGTALPESVIPDVPRDRNYRTPQDQATSSDHNLQIAYARQLNDSLGFRNVLSYRHFNDEYFLSEFLAVEPPSSVYREYLYFFHHQRPLTNLAELTARFTRGIEQNIVVGWEGQRYYRYTHRTPGGGVAEATPIDLFNPVETQPDLNLPVARIDYFTNKTNAFYFQDHLTLARQVKALVGARFDIFRRTSHADPVNNGVQTMGPLLRREAEALTGRLGLVYQPVPQLDLYGSFSNSFRPLTQAQPDGSSLDPETGSQYEFGQRFHMLGGRAELNTSVYRILRQKVAFARPGGVFVQAGEVRSRGFEADLQTSPGSNWRINAGYAFTDAEFLGFQPTLTVNLRGNTPTFVPRHTFNVWTAYEWPNGLGVNVGGRYFGSVFGDSGNVFKVDGYGVVNLGVRYRRGPLEYALNVNNLTDTEYFVPHQDFAQVYPGDPVNILGTVRVRLR